jgi:modification methylase
LTHWEKTEKSQGLIINFKDGSWVECTPEHRFPVADSGHIVMKAACDITPDDVLLKLGRFELSDVVGSPTFDQRLGELVGWYLAEGSYQVSDKGIQFSMAKDEESIAREFIELVRERFGVVGRIHKYKQICVLIFPSHFMVEFIRRFVTGRNALEKRLAREAFYHGQEFLLGILKGYLAGDAHWDVKNQRWALGFARNEGLISDLMVVSRILGYRLTFQFRYARYQSGTKPAIFGEIRENEDRRWEYARLKDLGLPSRRSMNVTHWLNLSRLQNYKIVTRKSRKPTDVMTPLGNMVINGDIRLMDIASISETQIKQFYELSVDGNHIFALANGLLTHNSNPMPNFRGVRFTNAHETLIWAKKSREQKKYTFNYHGLKAFNDGLQMRSDWEIPLCTGAERLTDGEGRKIHSTQKPEALLYRVLLATSNPGDIVLDPFFGTGTTGAVAKKLGRHYIGIERDPVYIEAAERRLAAISAPDADDEALGRVFSPRTQPRVKFSALLERGLLHPGQTLYLDAKPDQVATVLADGRLRTPDGQRGSIHQLGAALTNAPSCNGWDRWYYDDGASLRQINDLREQIRADTTA